MGKGIFVTGTGTNVGKTYVTGLLVKKLRSGGCNAGYYKPVLSGAEWMDGELVPGDCNVVCQMAGLEISPGQLSTYVYANPVSPHLAAKQERRPIKPEFISTDFAAHAQRHEFITVEGCGGIICPLCLEDTKLMQTDIILALGMDVLVVAPSGLGAINSAVLTAHYAQQQGIKVKGFILNRFEVSDCLHQDNRRTIEQLAQIPVVACVAPYAEDIDLDLENLCSLYKEN